ncbi:MULTISPECIES: undecaprenyl-diphosphate phosphatase [Sporomusa]|jgi:undecaprenyl-diphosphatase|uniref:Undecaprenyl-diphosphatase n=2 Tax=Sporomusa TaxID=2375 RepID=A0ABM9WAG8_9FIRM|nr:MULTISPECIES: undecaprenyl-diphosphate phosphatase [Sporomusa]MCM0760502.1 undecaprenyl-diphosphate phosphatase [Sporomusa sphaeroides DSM 2875]OLS56915.1 undecaprenyl-diphosphatase [Sporomusa sphaeroides DSM 2875]CVK21177.1 Undecaprenyl-diphosphatase [Sporomusa sphaeroides DSM 2875]SCM81805.1 Undecaprenyl-diphosphatase 1 [uncultured Sporomusa sp.]HML32092.1 undecaprenyl-diphosphate phosphatase [Sporomusa sphaeroides]
MSENMIAIIIGIVEGLTEFLPISSTGHMILVGSLLGFEGEKASVFQVFIQLGAILSVFILYRDKFLAMLRPRRINIYGNGLTALHVLAGIVPVMGVAFFLHSPIKSYLFSPYTVIIGLVAGAVLMLVAEKTAKRPVTCDVDRMTIKQAFWVGLFQLLSLWPGFSRSGSTIAGGLFLGMSRKAAAEFSFIIAVPLMLVACLYDLLKIWNKLSMDDIVMFAIGFFVAFITAYISIVWFLRFLNNSTLASFAYYRFVIAGVSYYYFFMR